DGRAGKCTLCYDRLKGGNQPACAQACPTQSIQFGPLEQLRSTAAQRLEVLHNAGITQAVLYGDDPADGVGGAGAMFLLLDRPETYGLPAVPRTTTRDLPTMWRAAARAAAGLLLGIALVIAGDRS
ncbi:MAG TPA: 4Fe-4S dicluster domain-containing protein, partial [Ilumatobacteraceae bacterium]